MKSTLQQFFACAAFVLVLGACSSDDMDEVTPVEVAPQATSEASGKGKSSTKDDDVGSMRYMVITETTSTTEVAGQLTLVGGTVEEVQPQIGVVIANATAADFATKALSIAGVKSVVKK